VKSHNIVSTSRPPFDPPEEDRAEAWGLTVEAAIKPIQTRWNGYRFRSRLEARWAVFFESIGITFEYEPEGFILQNGVWYLPDLLLPHVSMWAEVKPGKFSPEEKTKCRLLAQGTNRPCLMLSGCPDLKTYWAYTPDCGETPEVDFLLDIHYHRRKFYDKQNRFFACVGNWPAEEFTDEYEHAVNAARSVRFEKEAA
jgi:hypothetical protein